MIKLFYVCGGLMPDKYNLKTMKQGDGFFRTCESRKEANKIADSVYKYAKRYGKRFTTNIKPWFHNNFQILVQRLPDETDT